MYIDTLAYQTKEFFYSLGFGFILGMFYDLTRILRLIIYNGRKKAVLFDIFYASVSALMSVIFVLGACRGKFAFYVVLGISVGFAVYQFSLGNVFRKITDRIINFLRDVIGAVFSFLKRIIVFLFGKTVDLTKRMKNNKKKNKKNHKKGLQEE